MDQSQDRNEAHPQSQGAGGASPGARSGEGAASALQQVIVDNERQAREEPGTQDGGGSHPQ